ncbi:hypothetical protein DT603_08075 [Pseudoxanthomonas gei]|uniref:EF-hand domain-containing protein n=2 Tax=Pseudoxanthomonas gei TaxID=1383030 RepID=A0ABX0AB58_9GAMM|nr:hypothetical protein [Pseudoxanthomonas gei]
MSTVIRTGLACMLLASASASASAQAPDPAPAPVAQTQGTADAGTTFKRWDTNNDGSLSGAEFGAGWREVQAVNTLRNLRDNFAAKDADRNGTLDDAEYLKLDLVRKAGAAAPTMATFDADRNRSLDFKEYVGLVAALAKPKP